MWKVVSVLVLCSYVSGCGATATGLATTRTLPGAVAFSEVPADTTRDPIPPEDDWVVPVEDAVVAPGDVRSGVLLSDARAARAARLRIAYDELRALYLIDIRTWDRERDVYERYLQLADEEIATWRTRAQRSWWEENGDEFSLFLGLGLGIVLSVGVGAIIAELAP